MIDLSPRDTANCALWQGDDEETRRILREYGRLPAVREICEASAAEGDLSDTIMGVLSGESVESWSAKYRVEDDDQANIPSASWPDELVTIGLGIHFHIRVRTTS